jgi:hypothetical protein
MTSKLRIALGVLAVGLVAIAPAGGALVAPAPVGPSDGVAVDSLPAFRWNPVTGADHYEFELAADPGFNSTHTLVSTKNTRAALKKVLPNGTYFWRVRAVTAAGALGTWSSPRSLEMAWTARPSLLKPDDGSTISYPADALTLRWEPTPGAAKYLVRIATDPALGSLVWDGKPIETAATNFALSKPLSPGTYYWGITPLDPDGHTGTPSTVASFNWVWPSTTSLAVNDLVEAPEVFDPQLSWDPVPGASGYEVEVNTASAPDWPSSSKVCCNPLSFSTDATTLGTSFSPRVQLNNEDTYRWRVRALDAGGNAGVWNEGPTFEKPFDSPPAVTPPAVKNLHMRDNLGDPATDSDMGSTVLDTAAPVVVWDPVPNASSYEVNVAAHNGTGCDWATAPWVKKTATTAWTPLGWGNTATPAGYGAPSTDIATGLVPGTEYCVRVRAVDRASTIDGPTVFGEWTYLHGNGQPAFRWSGPQQAGPCNPCTMTSGNYVAPSTAANIGRMPLFTWKPIAGAESYFVVVARNQGLTNVVDFAFTRIPAYAPRKTAQTIGYEDNATLYWAVIPADFAYGGGTYSEGTQNFPQVFAKQSLPPVLVSPNGGAAVNTPATTFRWNPVSEGVRSYRLQVAQDATFSTPIDDILTDSTAYTSNRTYPSDRTLYWRVRAEAEDSSNFVALPWSASGTFRKQLPRPIWDTNNPPSGAGLPVLSWNPVPGAVSYDVQVEEADGDRREYTGFPTHAVSFRQFTGVGVTKVWVRANFPTDTLGVVHGPFSAEFWSYAHTIPEPANPTHEAGANRLLLAWNPRPAADEYRVQISQRPDFATTVETGTTQTTAYAPLLTTLPYTNGGSFWWRVAMVDADRNVGDYTAARSFTLPKTSTSPVAPPTTTRSRFNIAVSGWPALRRYRTITLSVRNHLNKPVYRAAVRVSGAGVGARTKYTSRYGKVAFRLRATRYPSFLTFRITKPGYYAKTVIRPVRPA